MRIFLKFFPEIYSFYQREVAMSDIIHDIIVQQYMVNLRALKGMLAKAKFHADTNKFDVQHFLDIKLAPDMWNFTRQIQTLSDNAKGMVARLAGQEVPSWPDTEKTWEELLARIDKTLDFVSRFKASDFKSYTEKKIRFPWVTGVHLEGKDYLVSYALPNFYFHLTTIYALLRAAGVPVGKADYIGEINWKKDS